MNYRKLNQRIDHMLKYDNDEYILNVQIDDEISHKLYGYQLMHLFNLLYAFRNNKIIIDTSDTGTGKTYTSVAFCKQLGFRPFIICPKVMITTWFKICELFGVKPLGVVNYDSAKNGKQYLNGKLIKSKFITVYENLDTDERFEWHLPYRSLIIFDEVHKCKGKKTLNAKLLRSTRREKVLMLSATLADVSLDFVNFGYMLGFYKKIKNGRNWVLGLLREDKSHLGVLKRSSLNKALYPEKGARMRINELGGKFPKNQICADCYDLPTNDQIKVNTYIREINDRLNELSEHGKSINGKLLGGLQQLRQKLERLKISIFVELIRNYLENGYAVAIFVNFLKTLKSLKQYFPSASIVCGGQELEERNTNIENFQKNINNVIICTIGSGGVALSLHDLYGVPRVSIISPSFSSIELTQTLGRIHRAGSKSPALQRIIYCANTYEEHICKTIQEKLKFTSKINDNDLINFKID